MNGVIVVIAIMVKTNLWAKWRGAIRKDVLFTFTEDGYEKRKRSGVIPLMH